MRRSPANSASGPAKSRKAGKGWMSCIAISRTRRALPRWKVSVIWDQTSFMMSAGSHCRTFMSAPGALSRASPIGKMSASAQKRNSQRLLLWLAHGSSGHSFRLGTPPHQFRTRNDRAEKRRTRSTSPGQEAAVKVDAFNFIRYGWQRTRVRQPHGCDAWPSGRNEPSTRRPLERDDFSSNRHAALTSYLSMIFSKTRCPLCATVPLESGSCSRREFYQIVRCDLLAAICCPSSVREVAGFQSERFDSGFRKRSPCFDLFIRSHHCSDKCRSCCRIPFSYEVDRPNG